MSTLVKAHDIWVNVLHILSISKDQYLDWACPWICGFKVLGITVLKEGEMQDIVLSLFKSRDQILKKRG